VCAGVPVPIQSAVAYKPSISSQLPRGRLVFTKGLDMYSYDPIMQHTKRIYDLMEFFAQPVGGGLNLGGTATCDVNNAVKWDGATVIPHADTATYWRDTLYDHNTHASKQGGKKEGRREARKEGRKEGRERMADEGGRVSGAVLP